MAQSHQPFGEYEGGDARRRLAWRDLAIWLSTSFGVGLVPFLFVALAFRAFHEADGGVHSFPDLQMLFGSGELLLVTLSVTGATLAELWVNPDHIGGVAKGTAIAASLFIAAAAGSLFTGVAYGHLTGASHEIDRSFVTWLSVALLIMVAVIQVSVLLTRPRTR